MYSETFHTHYRSPAVALRNKQQLYQVGRHTNDTNTINRKSPPLSLTADWERLQSPSICGRKTVRILHVSYSSDEG